MIVWFQPVNIIDYVLCQNDVIIVDYIDLLQVIRPVLSNVSIPQFNGKEFGWLLWKMQDENYN